MIKVFLAGYNGSMGQKAIKMIQANDDFKLVGGLAPSANDSDKNKYQLSNDMKLFNNLSDVNVSADVWVDFTVPSSVYENVKFAIEHGMRPVVGTTGLSDSQLDELKSMAKSHNLGGLIAPNFGLSAVLLMKFAQEAAQYFPDVEIIEMHHDDKKDAPSGTALNTAKLIDKVRPAHEQGADDNVETLDHVRGGDYNGIRIHAVRLPGYVAHEQVLFGGTGEALTIRQDSFDRGSFMNGVKIGIEKIMNINELVVGLENIM
ncbi:4-hydroxy-tetrahydrodipicolinate reductase [Apilactobacillus xinyiensis]|uniref:4-hydroxy-tetrahydrodipicolinate reductase n=1 Tax=Apilactobacillus xinyiensis TaxID=2841032 RepID=UPI001C7E01BC|nr:4-hydroxy-tetrahydrodipicolinate reductase [Apilactobacillus xinyiensis]MCL0318700.1 4-hydroxy-tetrahydrodipicolinate reductase [Apilactobacillus xinyiensis]